jgi:hypothetical protein
MAKHKFLKTAQSLLSGSYHVEFKDDNAIEICTNPKALPFAFVVVQKDFPNTFLLSLATDLTDSLSSAIVAIVLSRVTNTELVEGFYIDRESETHWGDAAYKKMEEEQGTTDPRADQLLKMQAISNWKN